MDLATTNNGDILKEGNDIVQLSIVDAIVQRIDHILRSKPGDWGISPDTGAYIQQYIGYPNSPGTKELIEDEVSEELLKDQLLGSFPIIVEYTPTAKNSGMLEITVELPDGGNITLHRELNPAEGINVSYEKPFTGAKYNIDEIITKTELITLEGESNVFQISHMPIDNNVFVVNYTDDVEFDENGIINLPENTYTQVVDFQNNLQSGVVYVENPSTGVMSGINLPSGAISAWEYKLTPSTIDVIENKMISSISVFVDDEEITENDYILNNYKLELRLPWETYENGVLVQHGVSDIPSGSVDLTIDYYNAAPLVSIDSFVNDSAPNNLFPRTRLTESILVTTKQSFSQGTYLVQYSTYKLEV
jgi:hypothetical protein